MRIGADELEVRTTANLRSRDWEDRTDAVIERFIVQLTYALEAKSVAGVGEALHLQSILRVPNDLVGFSSLLISMHLQIRPFRVGLFLWYPLFPVSAFWFNAGVLP